jgi:hypothetical protein
LPPLAALIDALGETSPLRFLKQSTHASVLRGGYTNCLYLVKVPCDNGEMDQWVVRKGAGGQDGDDPLLRVHRINRAAEHACVCAAATVGLTPQSHFDKDVNLLAQEYICEPETFDARRVSECIDECVELLKVAFDFALFMLYFFHISFLFVFLRDCTTSCLIKHLKGTRRFDLMFTTRSSISTAILSHIRRYFIITLASIFFGYFSASYF